MKLNPYLAIIIAMSLGGFNGALVKILDLPAAAISFFRMAVPTVVIAIFLVGVKKQRLLHGNIKEMFAASALNAARMFLYFLTFFFTTVGNGVLILYTWPIFASIFGVLFLKEKMRALDAALILLAFSGVAVMFGNQEWNFHDRDVIGMLLMLASAALYALTIIIYKKHSNEYSALEIIFYQNVVGAIAFLPFVLLHAQSLSLQDASIAGGFFGIVVGIASFLLIFNALKQLTTLRFSLTHYSEALFAVSYGVIFLDESLTWNMVLGGLFIILAGWLLIRKRSSSNLTDNSL